MGRPEKPLDPDAGPATAFARELRRLRAAAGGPSYREMARTALFSSTVLSDAAAGYRLPTLQVALAFAEACGGDRPVWERRWREAAEAEGGESQHPSSRPTAAKAAQRQEAELHAAAVRPLTPVPTQLPREIRPLAGRTRQLREARALTAPGADPVAPLVISGQLGVGASRFALRLAHELAAGLPDGQLYADFGLAEAQGRDASDIAAGFLGALGIPADAVPRDAGQRFGLYRSVLARRRVLILLDGVRHEGQVRELLDVGSESRIILTSRSRLLGLDGTRGLRLPVLDRDESVELLAELIGADRLGAAPAAAPRLAEACGDLPLALNLAGRRIAGRPEWLLEEAVTELIGDTGTEPARLLKRLRVGDESLRDRIEEAYDALPERSRPILHRFAAAQDASLEELLEELEEFDELDELDGLAETGLLEHTRLPGQYAMQPLVRAFTLAAGPGTADRATGTGTGAAPRRLTARRYDRAQQRPLRLVTA